MAKSERIPGRAGRRASPWFALVLALLAFAGCSEYHPVEPQPGQSWREARKSAVDPHYRLSNGHYIVLPGDSLSKIAARFGVATDEIVRINRLSNPNHILAGQVLRVRETRPRRDRTYVVRRGDNLSTIALAHGYRTTELMRANPRADPARLHVGSRISLPGSASDTKPQSNPRIVAAATPPQQTKPATTKSVLAEARPPELSGYGFAWPLEGAILETFGRQPNGARNDGINIRARAGVPVRAAENGVVVYAGDDIKAFGNMLLVRHDGEYLTTYAHLASMNVGLGDIVRRGQVIAAVGQTGQVTSPQLHFELRIGTEPLDPNRHLLAETTVASR